MAEASEMHMYALLIVPLQQLMVRELIRSSTEGCKGYRFSMKMFAVADGVVEVMNHILMFLKTAYLDALAIVTELSQ